MVYKFRIISDEEKDFARELLIHKNSTFLDFHHCLQDDLGYDPKQLASFFITNSSWEKKTQITLIDMMDDENEDVTTMDQAKIGDYVTKVGGRMLYVFDFFSERSFFIELTEIKPEADKVYLPGIVFSHGDPPPQIDLGIDNLDGILDDMGDDFPLESYDDDFDMGEQMDEDMDFLDSNGYDDD